MVDGEFPNVRTIEIRGTTLAVADHPTSLIRDEVAGALVENVYGIESILFRPGDVVIDIGANVGIVSLYIARRYPFVRVHAYEPFPYNHANLVTNIARNGLTNVVAHELAVTADGRHLDLTAHLASNSGGATAWLADLDLVGHQQHRARSTTLDSIFTDHRIDRCRFLKVDTEGSEHEILGTTDLLSRVDHLGAEIHINERLTSLGHSLDGLVDHCTRYLRPGTFHYQTTQMAE